MTDNQRSFLTKVNQTRYNGAPGPGWERAGCQSSPVQLAGANRSPVPGKRGSMDLNALIGRKKRPIPILWREAPNDVREVGFRSMLVVHIPCKKDWPEERRMRVAQRVADAALAAMQHAEDEA